MVGAGRNAVNVIVVTEDWAAERAGQWRNIGAPCSGTAVKLCQAIVPRIGKPKGIAMNPDLMNSPGAGGDGLAVNLVPEKGPTITQRARSPLKDGGVIVPPRCDEHVVPIDCQPECRHQAQVPDGIPRNAKQAAIGRNDIVGRNWK